MQAAAASRAPLPACRLRQPATRMRRRQVVYQWVGWARRLMLSTDRAEAADGEMPFGGGASPLPRPG